MPVICNVGKIVEKYLKYSILVSIGFYLASLICFLLFLYLNWYFINNPSLSSGFNCGVVFGDGGSVFDSFGIGFPSFTLYFFLWHNCLFAYSIFKKFNLSKFLFLLLIFYSIVILHCIFYRSGIHFPGGHPKSLGSGHLKIPTP